MSKHANISGADERPELFRQILPQSDADCLDETLQAMPAEDFYAAAVTGKALAKLGLGRADAKLTVVNETPVRETPAPKRRFRFRTVLIAACCAVLLLATVAVAKIMHDKKARVIEITELKEYLTAERASAFLPLGQSGKIGGVTVTAVDMIGDSHRMFVEVSTDVAVDAPDGWIICHLRVHWVLPAQPKKTKSSPTAEPHPSRGTGSYGTWLPARTTAMPPGPSTIRP